MYHHVCHHTLITLFYFKISYNDRPPVAGSRPIASSQNVMHITYTPDERECPS
jgi:hypothetical protein